MKTIPVCLLTGMWMLVFAYLIHEGALPDWTAWGLMLFGAMAVLLMLGYFFDEEKKK